MEEIGVRILETGEWVGLMMQSNNKLIDINNKYIVK